MENYDDQEIQHHDEIAERLLALSDREFRARELRSLYYQQPFISKMGKVSMERLLECGVGSGLIACYFAWHGAEVWGFDISQGMIEVANRRAKLWGVADKVHLKIAAFEGIDLLRRVLRQGLWQLRAPSCGFGQGNSTGLQSYEGWSCPVSRNIRS